MTEFVSIDELTRLVRSALRLSGYTAEEIPVIEGVLMYAQLRGNNQGIVKLTGSGNHFFTHSSGLRSHTFN